MSQLPNVVILPAFPVINSLHLSHQVHLLTMPNQVLQSISIIDTPGILSGEKQRIAEVSDCRECLLYRRMFTLVFVVLYVKQRPVSVTWPHTMQWDIKWQNRQHIYRILLWLLKCSFKYVYQRRAAWQGKTSNNWKLSEGKIMSHDRNNVKLCCLD